MALSWKAIDASRYVAARNDGLLFYVTHQGETAILYELNISNTDSISMHSIKTVEGEDALQGVREVAAAIDDA